MGATPTTLLRCTSAEEMSLGQYLLATPVAGLGQGLLRGRAGAWHAKVADRATLGNTPTIFGNLGSAYANHLLQREKFLVRDVLTTLCNADHPDEKMRMAVESMIEAEKQGGLTDRTLTLWHDGRTVLIADGNKRASAIYEANVAKWPLSVFLVRML